MTFSHLNPNFRATALPRNCCDNSGFGAETGNLAGKCFSFGDDMRKTILGLALLCLSLAKSTEAQPQSTTTASSGAYAAVSTTFTHDSSIGYGSATNFAAGYDFSRHYSLEGGIPYYEVVATKVTTSTGTQQTSKNAAGDLYATLGAAYQVTKSVNYKLTLRGAAPTGDKDLGVSTGKATWNSSNYLEWQAMDHVSPYVNAGFGNTIYDTRKRHLAYTTRGNVAPLEAGFDFDLTHDVSFDASTYYNVPFGNQTLYSRIVGNGMSIAKTRGRGARGKITQGVTTGSASLTEDHGYNGSLSYTYKKRTNVSLTYNRSVTDHLDSLSATLCFRLGHLVPNGTVDK
jgi:hypothetical protein